MRREDDEGLPPAWTFAGRVVRSNIVMARESYERQAVAAEFAVNGLAASVSRLGGDRRAARGRDGLRDLALKTLVAVDTNVRAAFDCAESLTQTADAADFFALQARFVAEQATRSMRQASELHRLAFDLLQRVAFGRPA